jgi:hypothetical protein
MVILPCRCVATDAWGLPRWKNPKAIFHVCKSYFAIISIDLYINLKQIILRTEPDQARPAGCFLGGLAINLAGLPDSGGTEVKR